MARAIFLAVCCAALVSAVSYSRGPAAPAPAAQRQACDERPTVTSPPDQGQTLECAGLPSHLAPAGSEAAAWNIGGNRTLVVWRTSSGSGLGIWRRSHGAWKRLLQRRRSTFIHFGISLGDVTGDGRTDVLATEASGGSGFCGMRVVFRVEADRAARLFRRHACELHSELRDGLLLFREPVGDCPSPAGGAHCYGGVRLTIRGWAGRRLVIDRTVVSCFRRGRSTTRSCAR